ncbi:hypothetical protein [Streptomyces sp. NPDC089919]|uniref:hypothetical protein n=1 Tax=Streptomyces sp. NPDC089919 TaxID=3155188 RepID=UPI00341F321B
MNDQERILGVLLRLYPAGHRREFGDEIAGAFQEATGGARPGERLREAADVAGHALRLRFGLGSAGPAGRWPAALAPFAAVGAGANALCWATLALRSQDPAGGGGYGLLAVAVALHCAVLLGAAVALAGRWAAGAWTVFAGVVAGAGTDLVRQGQGGAGFTAFLWALPLLAAVTAVACPPDLRPQPRVRTTAGVVAVAGWTAVLAAALTVCPLPYPLTALRFAVPVVAGLLLAGSGALGGVRTAPAVLGTGTAFLVLGTLNHGLAVPALPPLLGLLAAGAVAVAVRRRRGGPGPVAGG